MSLSGRAVAIKLGVTEKAVRKALNSGRITKESDGGYDLDKVRAAWANNTKTRLQRPRTSSNLVPVQPTAQRDVPVHEERSAASGLSMPELERREMAAKLAERQIRIKRSQGELVDAAKVQAEFQAQFAAEREALLNWPARLAGVLAAEIEVDEQKLQVALDKHIRLYLAERSGRPAR